MDKLRLVVILFVIIASSGCMEDVIRDQDDLSFEIILNNTDLCDYNHTSLTCNGTRQASTVYYANNSAIEIFLIAHANSVGQNATIMLLINGTIVEHTSGKPLAAPSTDNWKTVSAIIPKGASYEARFLNYHHFEWREYTILTGRNGTLNYYNITNTTTIGGSGASNLSQLAIDTNKNWQGYNITNISNINMTNNLYMGFHNIVNTSEFINYGNGGTAINFTVNRSYTGAANAITRFAQSSSPIVFTVTGNDLTGGYNFRVNMNPDQSQQDTTKAGWALVLKPFDGATGSRFQINRGIPGSSNLEAMVDIWANNTIYLGDSTAVNKNTTIVISNLTGSGNDFVCVDPNGVLFRSNLAC